VALAYARLAKVSLDLLIDDERDLPKGFLKFVKGARK
jgi:hypothetical protein